MVMGIIRTMGGYCYIECDTQNCNKKVEQNDEKALKQLAKLCNWENRGERWICPECLAKQAGQKR